ncbi:MAG: AzlC family ABC transporter permease [Treponema sp.]|jgi:4-azaleucine resistance transporter AzlC|nr:AzlC family ABC transporter permease [Treponema sp.]
MISLKRLFHSKLFLQALRYSVPVLLGYGAIGIAFGLLLVDAGYPWWLSLVMGLIMYAGAGQYLAVGLFAAGTTLLEAALVQLVVNARHIAYGFSMLKRFNGAGVSKYYLIFALTDETFALLSALPEPQGPGRGAPGLGDHTPEERRRFMCWVALLDQGYWVMGSVIGAVAGSLLPFTMQGIGFALTALFVVLMIEQILQVRQAWVFLIAAAVAVLAVFVLPSRLSLLSALAVSLALVQALKRRPVSAAP